MVEKQYYSQLNQNLKIKLTQYIYSNIDYLAKHSISFYMNKSRYQKTFIGIKQKLIDHIQLKVVETSNILTIY